MFNIEIYILCLFTGLSPWSKYSEFYRYNSPKHLIYNLVLKELKYIVQKDSVFTDTLITYVFSISGLIFY